MGVATTYNPTGNGGDRPSLPAFDPESAALPSSFPRFNAFLLAALVAAPQAFSADPPRETTSQPGMGPSPAARQPREALPPELAPTTVVTPLRDAPPAPEARKPVPIPEGPAPHIALIVPVASPVLGQVADSVRQGFMAAAEVAGRSGVPVRVSATPDDGASVLEACRKAQKDGAVLVVAGLTRDGATGLTKSDCPRQPTLMLNQPQDADLPGQMYSISLSLEQEARQSALMAINDSLTSAIVIASPSALAKRVQEAFEREWVRAAGEVRGRVVFAGGPDDAPVIKERIAAMKGDMVFLALDQAATRAVRPYISGSLPIYATSLSIDPRAEATVNVDLEGVRYVDMPWFVQPDHAAVMVYPPPRAPMAVEQERLYALGIDAYRLALLLLKPDAKAVTLDGVTGRIALGQDRHFSRTLVPAAIDSGRALPLRPPQ
jgi:outer membrane PBP1 activator LpoA protein